MDRIVTFLNNKYLVAILVGLFVLGFVKRIAGR
jgi:hypothetical protein